MTECPACGSEKTRRGGSAVWGVYVFLIAAAIPAVFLLHLSAGLVAGAMLAGAVLAHLVLGQRVCLACGKQWRR